MTSLMCLVIVHVVESHGIGTVESKDQTPVLIHPYGPIAGQMALESMQPPAWQIHVSRRLGRIQSAKLQPKPRRVLGLDSRQRPGPEEPLQASVTERLDH
jgi:hypothetical protein